MGECSDCGQDFHGAVRLALAWSWWQTKLSLPEHDVHVHLAMMGLGDALNKNDCSEEALTILQAFSSNCDRLFPGNPALLNASRTHLAACLGRLGLHDEALRLERKALISMRAKYGVKHRHYLECANNLGEWLCKTG